MLHLLGHYHFCICCLAFDILIFFLYILHVLILLFWSYHLKKKNANLGEVFFWGKGGESIYSCLILCAWSQGFENNIFYSIVCLSPVYILFDTEREDVKEQSWVWTEKQKTARKDPVTQAQVRRCQLLEEEASLKAICSSSQILLVTHVKMIM